MDKQVNQNSSYTLIEKVIGCVLAGSAGKITTGLSVADIASLVGTSAEHLERTFMEWAGVSFQKFQEYIDTGNLRKDISLWDNGSGAAEKDAVSSASPGYGFRVKDVTASGEVRDAGHAVKLEYGFASTPFGECFVGVTPHGICSLKFTCGNRENALAEFLSEWHGAQPEHNDSVAEAAAHEIFYRGGAGEISLDLYGTPFQVRVWKTLLEIPFGRAVTYGQLAGMTGNEKAVRAVASAVAANPIGYIVPCHRIVRSGGAVGKYHWGAERKAAMIGWEKSRKDNAGGI